jgi:23S rRNA (pseudouridine1915-N3)-methyltransferase
MKVLLLCVGGIKGPLESGIRDLEGRAGRYWRFQVQEVPSGAGRKASPENVRRGEEERLLARLEKEAGKVVALTREGKRLGSRDLADLMAEWSLRSVPGVTFVVGGAFGLGRGVLDRATLHLALSSMTLPHEVARLVLTEQIYRAGTILRNEPYHKGP